MVFDYLPGHKNVTTMHSMMLLLLPPQKFPYLPCCGLVVDNQKVWSLGRLQNRKSGTRTCLNLHSPVVTICTAHMYHQFNIQQICILPAQCIYVFCVDLRTNNDYFTVQHWLVGFYNWDGVCLLRGTFYIPRSAHTVYLCVLCGSENKQRLFHCTALTGWFL